MTDPFRILAIYGGGIRGIIPAIWLRELEKRLRPKKLSESFDLVVGTSTGSILAAAVACDIEIGDAFELYQEFGPRIFNQQDFRRSLLNVFTAPMYRQSELASALERVFGRSDTLGGSRTKLCITSYDVLNRQVRLLRSYDNSTNDLKIWECCKASSSAPSYFPAHIIRIDGNKLPLIDGGVAANNPALVALGEAVNLLPGSYISEVSQDIHLISMGTGSLTRKISISEAQSWGPANWALPILDVLFDASSDLTDRIVDTVLDSEKYVRMQIVLSSGNDDMDDASRRNMDELQGLAVGYLDDPDGRRAMNKAVKLLS